MRVIIGNPNPHDAGAPVPGPAITTTYVRDDQNEDGSYAAGYITGSDALEIKDYLFDNPGLVTHLPGNGLIVEIVRSWPDHGNGKPTWVAVDPENRDPENAADLERFFSEFWRCDRGIPADVEDTHHTVSGPPGTGPSEGE